MARPRAFDPDAVLNAAQAVFHGHGYEAASIQDLVDATGLGRSSLYAAYGDKRGLYLAVLDRYLEAGDRAYQTLCHNPSPLAAIRSVLEATARPVSPHARGCLLVNATAEVAGRDPETARRAGEARVAQQELFTRLVTEAQAAGEVAPRRPPEALARLLVGVTYGLRALQSAGAGDEDLTAVVEEAMAALAAV